MAVDGVATKVFFPMGSGPNDHGLSRKHVTEQCHASGASHCEMAVTMRQATGRS